MKLTSRQKETAQSPTALGKRMRDWCSRLTVPAILATTLVFPAAALSAPESVAAELPCSNTIQVIGLAGSGELASSPGEEFLGGTLTTFYTQLRDSFAGTRYIQPHGFAYLDYGFPDVLSKDKYTASFEDGVNKTTQYLAGRCKSEVYVLAGYSQGADAMMAVYDRMTAAQKNRVLGVALFGDPNFNPAASPLDEGSYYQRPEGHGIFGKRSVPSADFQAKARSYCLAKDVFCNSTLSNPVQATKCAAALASVLTAVLVGTKACPDLAGMSECILVMKQVPNTDCPHFNYPRGSTAEAAAFIHDIISPPVAAPSGTVATGLMANYHAGATATKLQNGDVLVVGGQDASGLASANTEIYHPSSNTWTRAAPMSVGRGQNHTATLLPDNRVLVIGGNSGLGTVNTAEIFNPVTGTWSAAAHTLTANRNGHAAVLLSTGQVLVAGGYDSAGGTAELFNPLTNTWSYTGGLRTPRKGATATLLRTGKVLLVGGLLNDNGTIGSAEIYDPAKGTWAATGSMSMPRWSNTPTLLNDGRVLVAGGLNGPQSAGSTQASAEIYNPKTGKWTVTQSMTSARQGAQAVTLPSGKVLVSGGVDRDGQPLATAELFDPGTGLWHLGAVMKTGRVIHTMTLLNSGKVLIAAGFEYSFSQVSTGEIYG